MLNNNFAKKQFIPHITKSSIVNVIVYIKQLLNPAYRKAFHEVKSSFREISGEDDIYARLPRFRQLAIPWLNSLLPLKGSSVLEIGGGGGASTIALAEQGCKLTSIDVDEKSISSAKNLCKSLDLKVDIFMMNASQIAEIKEKFDFIVFPSSLEHMTYDERITAIKTGYGMLKTDGFLVVLDTPNRLHYKDNHSSFLPFYHWLPDALAMQYAKYSPRELCAESSQDEMSFIRFGRGISFHEFELALGRRCNELEIYDMRSFINKFDIFSYIFNRSDYRYKKLLEKLGPKGIQNGFYHEYMYFSIKKT